MLFVKYAYFFNWQHWKDSGSWTYRVNQYPLIITLALYGHHFHKLIPPEKEAQLTASTCLALFLRRNALDIMKNPEMSILSINEGATDSFHWWLLIHIISVPFASHVICIPSHRRCKVGDMHYGMIKMNCLMHCLHYQYN